MDPAPAPHLTLLNQPPQTTFGTCHSGSTWDNYLLQEKWPSASTLLWMFCDRCYQVFWQFCIILYLKKRMLSVLFPLLRCFGGVYISFSLEGLWDWKFFSKLHCLFRKKGTYAALGNRSMNCPSSRKIDSPMNWGTLPYLYKLSFIAIHEIIQCSINIAVTELNFAFFWLSVCL